MLRHFLKPVLRNTKSGTRLYQTLKDKPGHMDDVVVPSGSWKEAYDKAQTKYTLQLLVGVASLIGAITVGRTTGILWLNYAPPTPKQ